jgi:hypothetical protein
MDEVTIGGVVYVPRGSESAPAESLDGMKYVIVRTYSAGVFAGYLKKSWESEGVRICKMKKARRIWYWSGAASLSQLAMEGTSDPANCKFPCEVDNIEIQNCIEIIDTTEKARLSINAVPTWKK